MSTSLNSKGAQFLRVKMAERMITEADLAARLHVDLGDVKTYCAGHKVIPPDVGMKLDKLGIGTYEMWMGFAIISIETTWRAYQQEKELKRITDQRSA